MITKRQYFFLGVLFAFLIFQTTHVHAKCISSWDQVDKLGSSVPGINLNEIKSNGSVKFNMNTGSTFTLNKRSNKIYAKTPEGDAFVSLCMNGGVLKATANLGILGKKEATITSLGSGNFRIKTKNETYKASVARK